MTNPEDKSEPAMTVIVRAVENGDPVEFTVNGRERAERLVTQLEEQGLTKITIEDLN